MKKQSAVWAGVLATMVWAGACAAQAQTEEVVRLGKIAMARIETPEYATKRTVPTMGVGNREKNWIEFSLPYKTAPAWLDELTVTYYVLLEPKEEPNVKYKLLKLANTYVNIKRGNHRSTAYIHPTTYERYGAPVKHAVVVSAVIAGRPFEIASDEQPWWRQLPAEDGLLLNRNDTPFAFLNLNDLEAMKIETGK